MQIKHGIDIVKIERIEELYKKFQDKFIDRIFTLNEQNYCYNKKGYNFGSLAKRFAAKEAFSKAIGEGIGNISFKDIEILNNIKNAPFISLSSFAKSYLKIQNDSNYSIILSLSDDYPYAMASVIIYIK